MSRARQGGGSRPRLRELGDRLGIIPEYLDQTGRKTVRTSNGTREALLAVLGFDAPTEDAAAGWLDALDAEERATIMEPVRVVVRGSRDAGRIRVRGRADGQGATRTAMTVELTLREEGGHVWRAERTVASGAPAWLELPARLPMGYHHVEALVRSRDGETRADQSLIVVPPACLRTDDVLPATRAMGVVANLYAQRRERDWGAGDLTTLMALMEWGSARGAAFVGVNPLHALYNRGTEISPYSPVSRLFRNHIYIDVEEVPEFGTWASDARSVSDAERIAESLRARPEVDYDGVVALKERVLTELHRIFRSGTSEAGEARRRSYGEFLRARDPELTRFATWMAIAEQSGVPDWRQWPVPLRDPGSEPVAAFRDAHEERVDFYRWLQFVTDEQLARVAARARTLRMPIGVYQDLAIGTSRGGSDTWMFPDLFVAGASVGAPPDPYSATGQDWGLPPIHPRALRQQRYRYWIQLLRRAFEHAGALRIDHVMGLFRQFWIPEGLTGREGAYVRFPAEDLLGILALESARHGAIVVGEDLGTVPPDVPPAMRKWGLLSSRVLYFERDERGFRPASRYPAQSLATANTHDMPTLAGFWRERDIELRANVGLLETPSAVARARRDRKADKRALLARVKLRRPRESEERAFPRALVSAVHEFLCSTPAALAGLSLDDLVGETDPVNVPGVGQDRYPSWRRRSRMTMEEIAWSAEVDGVMRCRGRRRTDDGGPMTADR